MNADVRRAAAPCAPLPSALPWLLALALALPATLAAQGTTDDEPRADPRTMTVEELERYIAEQKEALELVRENRDITAEKARRVREALEKKEAERRAKAAELEVLCREREKVDPGSLEACLAQIDGREES